MAGPWEQIQVFSGNSNPKLVADICEYLNIPVGKAEVFKFSNDNTFVRIGNSVRQDDVFVVQSFTNPVNDSIMEMLIMIDTLKRASAGRITAVIPYYGYGRTDKKDQPRVPITARLVAKLIVEAGADRVAGDARHPVGERVQHRHGEHERGLAHGLGTMHRRLDIRCVLGLKKLPPQRPQRCDQLARLCM